MTDVLKLFDKRQGIWQLRNTAHEYFSRRGNVQLKKIAFVAEVRFVMFRSFLCLPYALQTTPTTL